MTDSRTLPDPPFEFKKEWPPPGHFMTYNADVQFEGLPSFFYDMSAPAGTTNMTSLIVDRLGGITDADNRFRGRLYFAMGQLAVASGHVETAMKRTLIVLRALENSFALVDLNWTQLDEMLESESTRSGLGVGHPEIRIKLAEHLLWAKQRDLKTHRNHFIHGSIWDYDMPVLMISRFTRKSDGTSIVASMEDLERTAKRMVEYDLRLSSLLHGIWAEAMLPADPTGDTPETNPSVSA
jgi:hypothetical protein